MDIYVIDLDGTLADERHRHHHIDNPDGIKDWDAYFAESAIDPINMPILYLMDSLTLASTVDQIEIWTGRMEKYREITEKWLERHGVPYTRLRMRLNDDFRPVDQVKESWIDPANPPKLLIDDLRRTCEAFANMGVPTLQYRGFPKTDGESHWRDDC